MNESELVPLAAEAIHALQGRGWTLALAESCTGGLVGHLLTEVPGSSSVLLLDAVTYANEAKVNVLGVRPETLEQYGAVSEEIVREMARGAAALVDARLACSISGIAGPGGGSPAKPVGLVWFSMVDESGCRCTQQCFDGTRRDIKLKAARFVLNWIRRHCEQAT